MSEIKLTFEDIQGAINILNDLSKKFRAKPIYTILGPQLMALTDAEFAFIYLSDNWKCLTSIRVGEEIEARAERLNLKKIGAYLKENPIDAKDSLLKHMEEWIPETTDRFEGGLIAQLRLETNTILWK